MEQALEENTQVCLSNKDAQLDRANGQAASEEVGTSLEMRVDSISEEQNDSENVTTQDFHNGDESTYNNELADGQKIVGEYDGIPQVGMVFSSYGEVISFYKRYAMRTGFGVTIKKSSFNKKGLCRTLQLVCHKWGKGPATIIPQRKPTSKTNCEATIFARLWGDGSLHVELVKLEHNHTLNPKAACFLRCYKNKKLPSGMAKDLSVRGVGYEEVPYIDKEHLDSVNRKRLNLAKGDYEALSQFFSSMQTKNPEFFYLMDLDQEGSYLRNVFWADPRSRTAYKNFGDAVYFDSSYLSNRFEIPLVLFVGSNNHGQLVLMGCGLLSDVNAENFLWLFKTWLTCMSGRPPIALITDYSEAIQGAVAEVFPTTRHGFCLWKIFKKLTEKLKDQTESKAIIKAMKQVIYRASKIEELEQGWSDLIRKYGLEGNEWFNCMYNHRRLWAPAFLKDTFWAGLSTSRSEEHFDALYEGCIYQRTSLQDFLSRYEMFMRTKYELEEQADSDSFHKNRSFISKFPMEEQLSKIYTLNLFRKFQAELKATIYCQVSLVKKEVSLSTFEVKECIYTENVERHLSNSYEVMHYVDESEVQCSCGYFQFTGILCRHALSVLTSQQIYEIPSQYILKRWRKDAKQLHALDCLSEDPLCYKQMDKYNSLLTRCLGLAKVGLISDDKCQVVLKIIREVERSLLDDNMWQDLQHRLFPLEARLEVNDENHGASQLGIFETNITSTSMTLKRRGRPPKKRKDFEVNSLNSSSNKKDSSSAPTNDQSTLLGTALAASHLGPDVTTHGGIDLMEEVDPNDLSFGRQFGLHDNHQDHLGHQQQAGYHLQNQFGEPNIGGLSRLQWMNHQVLHVPCANIYSEALSNDNSISFLDLHFNTDIYVNLCRKIRHLMSEGLDNEGFCIQKLNLMQFRAGTPSTNWATCIL